MSVIQNSSYHQNHVDKWTSCHLKLKSQSLNKKDWNETLKKKKKTASGTTTLPVSCGSGGTRLCGRNPFWAKDVFHQWPFGSRGLRLYTVFNVIIRTWFRKLFQNTTLFFSRLWFEQCGKVTQRLISTLLAADCFSQWKCGFWQILL